MTRDLDHLWADDPPRQQKNSDEDVSTRPRIWDEQTIEGEATEVRPSSQVDHSNELEELWERPTRPHPPPASRNGRRASRKRDRARVRSSKAKRVGLIIAAGILLLLVADGAWAALTLRGGLETSETQLRAGVAALADGDLEGARSHFRSARDGAGSASSSLDHPTAALASITPGVTRDVDVVRALGEASDLAAESGLTAVELAEELGVTSDGFASSLYSDGRVNLDALGGAEPFLAELVDQLADAEALLGDAPDANFGILSDAQRAAGAEVARAGETARKSSEMFGALPTLLGAEEKQTYFLAFQTLSEARGTGGLIGLWGVLSADDGEIALQKVAPIRELTTISTPPSSGPKWYEKRYEPFGALVQWQQTNFSPNLPVVSEVLLERFEAAKGWELDGVVAMDPVAMGLLSRGTGPVSAPGLGVAVTEENAREVLLRSVYEEFESNKQQNAYLSALITSFWDSIESGDVNATDLLAGVGEATSTRHLAVYSSDEDAQEALVNAEAAGTYENYGPNVQMVFNNNLAANKLDYFMKRSIDTKIVVQDSGDAVVTTAVKVRNDAPNSGSALLNSAIPSDPPGLNRLFLNALLPKGAEVQKLTLDGEFRPEVPDDEDGFPTVWDIIVLESGKSATMKVTYVLEDAFADASFDLTMIPAAAAQPDSFSLKVRPPDGFTTSIDGGDGTTPNGSSIKGVLHSVRTYTIQLAGT